ncbi:pseudouridine synthase [Jiulongibacter sp. NS-SX5]|uniref:pseudouridine synthase n=1 Tax=Jiulongibacter sp. NS-SX5 TaxID=3463854 RepID=UPI004059DFFB
MAKRFDKKGPENRDENSENRGRKSFRKFDKQSGKEGDKPPFKKFGRGGNEERGPRTGQQRFRRDDRNEQGERNQDNRRGGFRKFSKGKDGKRDGQKRFDKPSFGKDKRNFRGKDENEPHQGRGRRNRDFYKDRKPESDERRGNFRSFDKEDENNKRTGFRKFGNKREDRGNDRQVGMKRPPRYDEESLKRKAPFRAKQNMAEKDSSDKEEIRLNKYIANAGLCSRREADELIASGMIKVNGKVVTEMGYKVKDSDTVKYGKDVLSRERMMYILLNKPKDFITTMDDPEERKTVMDLVSGACKERVYPVGRLDRNTTGLLLLTNDGELTEKLTHPSSNVKKIYQAELDKPFTEDHFDELKMGIELEDGFIKPDQLAYVTPDAEVVGLEIHSGKNRVVRRIFKHLGYEVTKLDRTTFAGLTKKDLPRGKWRFLSEKEVIMLKYLL